MIMNIGKQQRKSMQETDSSRGINKIDKPLARLTERQRQKTQITNISNETDQYYRSFSYRTIKVEYYKQLNVHKFDSMEEMDQFLKKYKLPKFKQYEIDNLNSPITIEEIELIKENLLKDKPPEPYGFTGELY